MNNKLVTIIAIIIILLVIGIGAIFYFSKSGKIENNQLVGEQSFEELSKASGCPVPSKNNTDDFAKCLTDKGFVMYGAVWCSHCQNQKKLFGDSFKFIDYVECPDNIKRCLDTKIESYPTWIF